MRATAVSTSLLLALQLLSASAGAAQAPVAHPSVFRGHFRRGFEHSAFVPCPVPGVPAGLEAIRADSAWYLPAAVWVPGWGNDRRGLVRYPDAAPRAGGPQEWFVVWRGAFSAPGHHGHASVARYEFVVDSVLAVRTRRPDDCLGAPPAAP